MGLDKMFLMWYRKDNEKILAREREKKEVRL